MNRLNTLLKKKTLTPKEYKEMLLLTRKLFKSAGINLYQPVTRLMSYAYDGIAPRTYIKKGDQIEAKAWVSALLWAQGANLLHSNK